jgi:hypothetical protein
MMNRLLSTLSAIATVSVLTIGCGFEHTSTNLLSPSPGTTQPPPATGTPPPPASPMIGTWVSPALPPNSGPNTCGGFRYQITAHVGTSISGGFTGECANGLTISGNAAGQLNGTALTMTATGEGTKPGVGACAFSLGGTGTIEDNGTTLRLSYSATTCLGPTSGAGVLRKQP